MWVIISNYLFFLRINVVLWTYQEGSRSTQHYAIYIFVKVNFKEFCFHSAIFIWAGPWNRVHFIWNIFWNFKRMWKKDLVSFSLSVALRINSLSTFCVTSNWNISPCFVLRGIMYWKWLTFYVPLPSLTVLPLFSYVLADKNKVKN